MRIRLSKSCRICDSVLSRAHYVSRFSRESLASDLANRLSKVARVPVASEDGLSRFICIPCKNKLASRVTVYGKVYKLSIRLRVVQIMASACALT